MLFSLPGVPPCSRLEFQFALLLSKDGLINSRELPSILLQLLYYVTSSTMFSSLSFKARYSPTLDNEKELSKTIPS